MRTVLIRALVPGLLALVAAACGDTTSASHSGGHVVVTTSVLGDVVRNLVGPDVDVEVVVPAGVEAHAFAPSAKQAASMRAAKVIITNGRGLEEALLDTVEAAEGDGATVIAAADHLEGPEVADPHFFNDPVQMQQVVRGLTAELQQILDLDEADMDARAKRYLEELERLDHEIEELLGAVPNQHRLLVTSHDVLGHFGARYDFDVDSIAPADEALGEVSPARIDELAKTIASRGVPAVFLEEGAKAKLVDAVAAEGGSVVVVAIYGEALGPDGSGAETYLTMMRTNAERIAEALT